MLLLAIVSDEIDQMKSCVDVELGSSKEAHTHGPERSTICGQSYKQFTLVNYDSELYWLGNYLYYDPRVVIYERKLLYKIGHWYSKSWLRYHSGSEAPLDRQCSLSISIISQIYPPSAANLNLASKQMDADVYLDDGITKLDVKNMKNDIQILLGRMRSKRPELVTVPR